MKKSVTCRDAEDSKEGNLVGAGGQAGKSFPADSQYEALHFFTDMSILMSDGSRQIASTSDVFDYGNSYFYSSQPDSQPGNGPVTLLQQCHFNNKNHFTHYKFACQGILLIKVNFVRRVRLG